MSKLGIEIKIDVTKLDKAKFFKGKKGTYCTLTVFVDPNEEDAYGNHGGIYEKQGQEEQQAKVNKNYVGNAKVFWSDTNAPKQHRPAQPQRPAQPPEGFDDMDEDIPF